MVTPVVYLMLRHTPTIIRDFETRFEKTLPSEDELIGWINTEPNTDLAAPSNLLSLYYYLYVEHTSYIH